MKSDFCFFGTGPIAVLALDEMLKNGAAPALVITAPDRPRGRGHNLSPSPVAEWTAVHEIETHKPERLNADFVAFLALREFPVMVTIDYGAILPPSILTLAPKGILNMHPSLLPRLRGPSPIRSAILHDEKKVGVTVMLVDEKIDHGPIIAQEEVATPHSPMRGHELDELLAQRGGALMAVTIPLWLEGAITPVEQDHTLATKTGFFKKEDGLINLSDDAHKNLLKIRAFDGWPGTYTFFEKQGDRVRVQILDAHVEGSKLILDIVKPEGKNQMKFSDFARSGALPAHN